MRELKVRTGPKPKDRIGRPSEMTDKEWWDFKETYQMKFRPGTRKAADPICIIFARSARSIS